MRGPCLLAHHRGWPPFGWFRISPHFTDEETEARGAVLLLLYAQCQSPERISTLGGGLTLLSGGISQEGPRLRGLGLGCGSRIL